MSVLPNILEGVISMTKRERFMNFLSNKPVDRVPVAFFHHFTASDEWGKGLVDEDIFRRNIEGHRTALERFDPDVIKIMNDSLMIMPLDTSFVKTAADLRNIQPPTPDSPYGRKTWELTERSIAIYAGNEAFIYATGFSPLMVLKTSLDPGDQPDPRLPRFLQEDPESVMAALDILAKAIMDLNEMLIKECGVDGIYFSVNNQNHYIPDDLFTKYMAPVEIRVMEHANGLSPINLLHICGYHGRGNNLELFKTTPPQPTTSPSTPRGSPSAKGGSSLGASRSSAALPRIPSSTPAPGRRSKRPPGTFWTSAVRWGSWWEPTAPCPWISMTTGSTGSVRPPRSMPPATDRPFILPVFLVKAGSSVIR